MLWFWNNLFQFFFVVGATALLAAAAPSLLYVGSSVLCYGHKLPEFSQYANSKVRYIYKSWSYGLARRAIHFSIAIAVARDGSLRFYAVSQEAAVAQITRSIQKYIFMSWSNRLIDRDREWAQEWIGILEYLCVVQSLHWVGHTFDHFIIFRQPHIRFRGHIGHCVVVVNWFLMCSESACDIFRRNKNQFQPEDVIVLYAECGLTINEENKPKLWWHFDSKASSFPGQWWALGFLSKMETPKISWRKSRIC